ncbi:hypothetical protein [Pseudoalteromonas sp. S16_S37]|uniref:hypothetical protein n=1 Tax=Pseudoalteromonas sp. S16_S37 TaxID=2720228 RepID=UPI001680D0F1|nr:hypothetical protein [Pseudoalteromonas sp. S16_S37]MBD1581923.1 hypothetical protein [Pseudoalteromonas sp. S16_S37]
MKYLFSLLVSLVLTGCAVTGTASKAEFPLLTNAPNFNASVNSVSIIADENSADNESYGAFNWGRFDETDRNNIQQVILETLKKNTSNSADNEKVHANVHAKIHRYSQVITNASYASFVIVDWCLEKNGEIIIDEVFYAGHSDELDLLTGKSLGWAKGETHKAIASRIINQTIQTLSEPSLKNAYPEEHVFLNADDAVHALPTQLTSVGTAGFSGGIYYYVSPTTGETNFHEKSVYQKVNWKLEVQKGN